jgi:hypothetical protein
MSEAAENSLAELIAREQRGFRRILFAGLATILLMGLMSAALGVYLYAASRNLAETTRTLQRQAFDTRQRVDQQSNRIAAQEIAMRRIYDEIRRTLGDGAAVAATPQNLASAVDAAANYLLRGRVPSLANERLIRTLSMSSSDAVSPNAKALLTGVLALVDFDARGDQIPANAAELPQALTQALGAFETARADGALAPLANVGIAWVRFRDASSGRNNYSAASCAEVFSQVEASVLDGLPSPQPLYWRAQCERKLGLTREALVDYARALRDSQAVAAKSELRDPTETALAMNAFHGVGTTLIAAKEIPESQAGVAEALGAAREACPAAPDQPGRSERMALALACLNQAVALRRELKQTDNQLSGTGENMSFAYLRDGDYNAAYDHAAAVERTGLFAWNEAVRALSASRAQFDDAATRRAALAAGAEARRNVSFFNVGQFNVCELQALLSTDDYAAVVDIIADAHPDDRDKVACAAP